MIPSGNLLPTKQLILDLLEEVNACLEEACVTQYISRPLGTVSHLFSLLLLPAGYRLVILMLLMCDNHNVFSKDTVSYLWLLFQRKTGCGESISGTGMATGLVGRVFRVQIWQQGMWRVYRVQVWQQGVWRVYRVQLWQSGVGTADVINVPTLLQKLSLPCKPRCVSNGFIRTIPTSCGKQHTLHSIFSCCPFFLRCFCYWSRESSKRFKIYFTLNTLKRYKVKFIFYQTKATYGQLANYWLKIC